MIWFLERNTWEKNRYFRSCMPSYECVSHWKKNCSLPAAAANFLAVLFGQRLFWFKRAFNSGQWLQGLSRRNAGNLRDLTSWFATVEPMGDWMGFLMHLRLGGLSRCLGQGMLETPSLRGLISKLGHLWRMRFRKETWCRENLIPNSKTNYQIMMKHA